MVSETAWSFNIWFLRKLCRACLFTLLVGQAVWGARLFGGFLLAGEPLCCFWAWSCLRNQKSERLERYLQDLESIKSAGHSFWVAVYLQVAVVTQEC